MSGSGFNGPYELSLQTARVTVPEEEKEVTHK